MQRLQLQLLRRRAASPQSNSVARVAAGLRRGMKRAARSRIETPRASLAGFLFKSSGQGSSRPVARLRVLWLHAPVLRGCCSIPAAASTPDAAECGSAGPAPDVRVGRRRHAVRPAVRAPLTLWVHARPRAPPLLFSGRGVPRGHRRTHRAAGCREAETCLWGPWGPTWTCQGSSWWLAKGVRGGTAMVSLCDWDIHCVRLQPLAPALQYFSLT